MRTWMMILFSVFLLGCAMQKPMTREQQIKMQNHSYPGHSPEEVIRAAEKVLVYADESDTEFAHQKTGFRAQRDWLVYMVFAFAAGTWHWQFQVEPAEAGGTSAQVAISGQAMSVAGTPTGAPGGVQTSTLAMPGRMVTQPAIFELFWARVDYFLDLREEWPDCKDWWDRVNQGKTWGSVEMLCGPGSEHKRPADAPDPDPGYSMQKGPSVD